MREGGKEKEEGEEVSIEEEEKRAGERGKTGTNEKTKG